MVSVIIPTFNRAYCIEKSINSVLNQTYRDFELIIIDDGSTDNTREIIENIDDIRIRYFYQKNSGANNARNYGIDVCEGEYIAFHDSDDVWRPDKLEKQVSICSKFNPEIQFCKIAMHCADGSVTISPKKFSGGFCDNPSYLFGIGTGTIFARKTLFSEYRFDKNLNKWQDLELLLRISQKHKLYCLDEVLYDHYLQNYSISNKSSCEAAEQMLKKHPSFPEKYHEMSTYIANTLLREAGMLRSSDIPEYAKCLKVSKKFNKSMYFKIKCIFVRFGLYEKVRVWKHKFKFKIYEGSFGSTSLI